MSYRLSVSLVVVRRRKNEGERVLVVTSRRWGGVSLPGGKVDPGETFEEAAARELEEETGCSPLKMTSLGVIEHDPIFDDADRRSWLCKGFVVDIGDQEPVQCEEGTIPSWVRPGEIAVEDYYRSITKDVLTRAGVDLS